MGAALLGGMLASGEFEATSLAVVEQLPARRDELVEMFPDVTVVSDVPPCTGAVIAVKPQGVADAVRDAVSAGARRIVSIAAGVTLASLDTAAGPGVAVVRAMPNTPALIGQGASAMAGGKNCSAENVAWAKKILLGVGTVVEVEEDLLDAVTGLSGSGPAYVFLLAEALIAAGVEQGLTEQVSNELVRQLLVGSSLLLAESSETPEQLRKKVTSPNGTTAAGIAELVGKQFAEIIAGAVSAATARSKELGS